MSLSSNDTNIYANVELKGKNIENIHSHDYSYIFEHTYQNGQKLDNDIPHF